MDLKYILLILVPAVLGGTLLILNAIKDKTKSEADNKAASLIEKILSLLGKKPE